MIQMFELFFTDKIQFAPDDVSFVPLGRKVGQSHFDDRVRINVGIVDIVTRFMNHKNVYLAAAGHAVTNDTLTLAGL